MLVRALIVCAVIVAVGCTQKQELISEQATAKPLVSVWAQLNPDVLQSTDSPDTLFGDFQIAAKARTEQSALESWRQFLKKYDPEDGFFEDGMHSRLVDWAKAELVRLQHRVNEDFSSEQAQIEKMRKNAEF